MSRPLTVTRLLLPGAISPTVATTCRVMGADSPHYRPHPEEPPPIPPPHSASKTRVDALLAGEGRVGASRRMAAGSGLAAILRDAMRSPSGDRIAPQDEVGIFLSVRAVASAC